MISLPTPAPALLVTTTLAALISLAALYWTRRRRWVPVGRVQALYIFPLKEQNFNIQPN